MNKAKIMSVRPFPWRSLMPFYPQRSRWPVRSIHLQTSNIKYAKVQKSMTVLKNESLTKEDLRGDLGYLTGTHAIRSLGLYPEI